MGDMHEVQFLQPSLSAVARWFVVPARSEFRFSCLDPFIYPCAVGRHFPSRNFKQLHRHRFRWTATPSPAQPTFLLPLLFLAPALGPVLIGKSVA